MVGDSVLTSGGASGLGSVPLAGAAPAASGFSAPNLFEAANTSFQAPSFLSSLGLNGRDLLQLGAFGVASAAQASQADKNRAAAIEDRNAGWAREDAKTADARAREDAKLAEEKAYVERLRQEKFQRMKPTTGLLAPTLVRKG